MTYAVDLARSVYYFGTSEFEKTVLHPWYIDLAVILVMFTVFIIFGTFLFVRNERNR